MPDGGADGAWWDIRSLSRGHQHKRRIATSSLVSKRRHQANSGEVRPGQVRSITRPPAKSAVCQAHETHAAAWATSRVSYRDLTLATLKHSGCHGRANFKSRRNPGHWHGGSDVPQLEAAAWFLRGPGPPISRPLPSCVTGCVRAGFYPFLTSSLKLRRERG
jgi:hypothetical protein